MQYEMMEFEAVEIALGDNVHPEGCDYTYKATIEERIEHYMTGQPTCDGFVKSQVRTDIVEVPNRRGGKHTIHRPLCPMIKSVERAIPIAAARPDHRINKTCGFCLKGQSTFSVWAK